MNNSSVFPIDLELDKIAITIDERCLEYTVGESPTMTPTVTRGTINAFNRKPYLQQKETH